MTLRSAKFAGNAFLTIVSLVAIVKGMSQVPERVLIPVAARTLYIDAHAHFDEANPEGSVRAAISALSRQNASRIFLLSPPDTFDHPGRFDIETILPQAAKYPGKLVVIGGGGSLNAMIIKAAATGNSGPAIQKEFRERAEELLRLGVAGFGEMTAEHFSGATPYQYAPADHPLFLMLADIAAMHNVPMDLHMEAVPMDMMLPAGLKSPPNPPQLHANIAAFERLLTHNGRARIVWAHAGADGTGFRTPNLCRRMLSAHPNLYMEIKADPLAHGMNYPLAEGRIQPDWLALFRDFPDRFIIGSDQHYPEPKDQTQRWQETVLILNQLPQDIRQKIGMDNVLHIYGGSVR